MKTGLKVWLWIVFVLNVIGCVLSVAGILVSPIWGTLALATSIVFTVGVGIILFKQQKLGLWLMCGAQVVGLILSIITGGNIVTALVQAVLAPLITYLFMRPDWDSFK